MSDLMPESTVSYLRRVLPDIESISVDVLCAMREDQGRRYSLSTAITKVQKLLDDLMRAERSDQ